MDFPAASNPKFPIHMRVVWAVDPNERSDSALHHRARKVLRRLLTASAESVVEPVYVFRMSTAVSADVGATWRDELIQAADDSLRKFLRHAKIPGLATPRVLFSGSSSYRLAANVLSDHASRTGADLIIAQTHGRSGLGRLILGSFAETLLLTAKTPVLLVNPKTQIQNSFGNILFPSDFSRGAANQLRDVLDLANRFGAKVTLFNAIETVGEALLLSSTIGPTPILPEHRREQAERARKHAGQWIEIARKRGVEMNFVLRERTRSPGDDIIAVAKKTGAGMIAMQTNSGTLGAALLGSTTRHVVRKSHCPVWILKPARRRTPAARVATPARTAVTPKREIRT